MPATRWIIGAGPTARVSAKGRVFRVYSTAPFLYIKEHTENTAQSSRAIHSCFTLPFVDESPFKSYLTVFPKGYPAGP